MKKGRLTRAGGLWPERLIFMIHNLQKLVHMQRRALAAESDYVRKMHRHNPAAHSRSRPTRAKRGAPSLTHRPHPTANFIRLRGSAAVGPESLEADGCPSFLYIEKAHSARRFPLKDIACVLLAQTKDAKIVCVIGFQITRTRIHTQS